MNWNQLVTLNQLEDIDKESLDKPVVIFKHSTRCAISRMALRQFENQFDTQQTIIPYFLDLLEHRDVSNAIASRYHVVHQSPQIIVIKNESSVYNASHEGIDATKLREFI